MLTLGCLLVLTFVSVYKQLNYFRHVDLFNTFQGHMLVRLTANAVVRGSETSTRCTKHHESLTKIQQMHLTFFLLCYKIPPTCFGRHRPSSGWVVIEYQIQFFTHTHTHTHTHTQQTGNTSCNRAHLFNCFINITF
jgi:hypothetical protein